MVRSTTVVRFPCFGLLSIGCDYALTYALNYALNCVVIFRDSMWVAIHHR